MCIFILTEVGSLSLSLSLRLGPVFALFVPFFCSVPRVQVTQLLRHVSISNKSLVYIVGLQVSCVTCCKGFSIRMCQY